MSSVRGVHGTRVYTSTDYVVPFVPRGAKDTKQSTDFGEGGEDWSFAKGSGRNMPEALRDRAVCSLVASG